MMIDPRALAPALQSQDPHQVARVLGFEPHDFASLWQATAHLSPQILATLAQGAGHARDPAQAYDKLIALLLALGNVELTLAPEAPRALAIALTTSVACARYLRARPRIALPILAGRFLTRPKPHAIMRGEARRRRAGVASDDDLTLAMAGYRVREWVRIVTRDLAQLDDVAVTLKELSDLAQVVIDTTTRYHLRRERSQGGPRLQRDVPLPRPAGFAVIAQGKLGGGELNVSSDVDIQYIYASDDAVPTAPKSLHERFCTVAHRITQSLSVRTAFGASYRVDLDLRPEGSKGPLTNAVASAEAYYESWGQTWERLALVRAAHVGGNTWVGHAFLASVRPFVFPRSLDLGVISEVRALNDRVLSARRSKAARRGHPLGIDVKRDPGGIRDIELFVQIHQFLNGGRNRDLRTPSIWAALERLRVCGHLSQQEWQILHASYSFLRRVENALQAHAEGQTHRIPDDPDIRATIAHAVAPGPAADAVVRFDALLQRVRQQAQAITQGLFTDPVAASGATTAAVALWGEDGQQRRALHDLGFRSLDDAMGLLVLLQRGRNSPFSTDANEQSRQLAPLLLSEIAASPDPDMALRLTADLDAKLRRMRGFYRLITHTPLLRRRLFDLLGTSAFLGRAIVRHPDLIERFAEATHDDTGSCRSLSSMQQECNLRLDELQDIDLKLRSLRRFKLQELLRIGSLDLAGRLELEQVTEQLAHLGEVCLRAALRVAREALADARTNEEGFAVIGLGRFGAGEMGYGSDLDLLFVYDDAIFSSVRTPVRLAQRLIQVLALRTDEGPLYPIDTRLRPAGNQGPLVSTNTGFVRYHRQHAMLWEWQALLRARPVAGDMALGARVLQALESVRYPPVLPREAGAEIHRLRLRMEREIARENIGRPNLKTGRGGLVDLDFVVQYLLLQHAHRHPALRVGSTLKAIAALEHEQLIEPADANTMVQAYRFLRFLENRLRMVHNSPMDAIDLEGPHGEILARCTGFGSGPEGQKRLRHTYQDVTSAVRALYERHLHLADDGGT